MTSLQDILSSNAEDFPDRPKPVPAGSYLCVVQGFTDGKANTGTEYLQVNMKPIKALDDVDRDQLEEAGGIQDKILRHTLWVSDDSKHRWKTFVQNCGVEIKKGPFEGFLNKCVNRRVVAHVTWTPAKDGGGFYANVNSTAPAE